MVDLLCHIRYTGVSLFLLLICLLDIGPKLSDNKIPHWLYFQLGSEVFKVFSIPLPITRIGDIH
jgi:hypothetical protein